MVKKIILVTGGQRSGKSGYAQKLALQASDHPVYLATSRIWDEEYRQRIERHQRDRGPQWTNIEEEKQLSKHPLEGRVVVIDCLTLWATNFFCDNNSDVEKSLEEIKQEFNRFTEQEATFIFVTNEIGMGEITENTIQRRFTDLQGWMNQYAAQKADEVILMVSGIAIKAKG
ncbi:MAG: bifunctional adenosylcobinamide kinase/adenosylcobinamide-phosphate guanylyltransferase [Odoribacter sp.]